MSNPIRFGGLASGTDTESMVKQLMQSRRAKLDVFNQRKTKNEWKQEAYHKVNKDLANFILDSRKKLGLTSYTYNGQLRPNSIDKVDWAKKATVENDEFLTAKATAGASGTYDVEVKQLAQAATATGKAVSDVKSSDKVGKDIKISLKVNGELKEVDIKADETIAEAIKKIKEKTDLNISFGKVGQDSTGKETSMLFMSTKKTGSLQEIISEDEKTQAFFEKLGFEDHTLSQGLKGKNSIVNVNGSEVENQTNDIDINGLQLSLKKVSTSPQKITINTDTDAVYNKIKEFVDGYNKIIANLQDKIKEKQYKDYQPLTKEQKEALKEEDIKLWEEKARSGLLNDDRSIKSMISNIRTAIYEKVEGAAFMHEIGITTGNYKDGAKIQIDEKKLKEAISKDPQQVLDTLFKSPQDIKNYKINKNDSAEVIAEKKAGQKMQKANTGVFVRIMDEMSLGMENIIKQAGTGKDSGYLKDVRNNILADFLSGKSLMDEENRRIGLRIDRENDKLSTYEASLWKKFGAMEKAIQQMQNQSGWLMQQFGGK